MKQTVLSAQLVSCEQHGFRLPSNLFWHGNIGNTCIYKRVSEWVKW
jgi:hypothetical protein